MKKLFSAIRNKNRDEVSKILDKDPELVNGIAKGISKKDDGEIPLQTAIKTDNYDIAKLLIERGANVKFMEKEIENEEWRKPVLHFAISAAVRHSRFALYIPKYSAQNTSGFLGLFKKDQWAVKDQPTIHYQKALEILKLVVEKGAELHSTDNYGISAIERLCTEIENIQLDRSKPLSQESVTDLYPIFELLNATKSTDFALPCKRGNTVYEHYKNTIDQIIGGRK